jgi:UDP-N-acetylmuramoylalanine--D-glutamate ligase
MNTGSEKKTAQDVQRSNPLEHSMEAVAEWKGAVYVNDSISINVESTWRSLTMCEGGVILLIGGIDSRNDYTILEDLVSKKVRMVICLGTDNSKLMRAFLKTGVEITAAASLQEAVDEAAAIARAGEVVLFSPSCPSYHPFDNYKNRGNDFRRAVLTLTQKESS